MLVYMFFNDFSGLRALREAKVVPYGTVVDNALLKYIFRAVRFPARAWHHVLRSHGLDIMARAVAATVARDHGSDSSLLKLREISKELELRA